MRHSLAAAGRIGIFFILNAITLGCSAVFPLGVVPTTPTPSPASPPTPCNGPYTWAYGTVPPEFIGQLQEAMRAAGLAGSAQASTFGENDGCGGYHAMAVDYVFTVQVESLGSGTELASVGERVLEIATRFVNASPAPNLGHLRLVFRSGDQECQWGYGAGAWNSVPALTTSGVACPAPTTAASQRLADALNALSVDLACETSTVTTDTQQAALECERPEGENRYIVTVTFRLNGQGYEGACFHGYEAFESSPTGDTPMTVTDSNGTYYERDRSFQWSAGSVLYELFERIKGGQDVTLPPDTRERVFTRALAAGLIEGEGNDCP